MYSKLVVGLAVAGSAMAAEIVRRDTGAGGGHAHSHDHGHAAAPSSGYSEPAQSYAAPSTGYSQPSSGYSSPSTGYGGYSDVGYEEERFDLSTIIIPILIIFGLSLLFPTITSVAVSGRKKRDVEGSVSTMTDVVERVNDIYMAVVESEECMERIACELGGLASDVGLKDNSIAKMADPFVPAKYKSYYKQFKAGTNCHKIKCGSIF